MSNQGCVCFSPLLTFLLMLLWQKQEQLLEVRHSEAACAPGGTARGLGEGAAAQGTGAVLIYSTSLIPAISFVCPYRHH